MARTKTNDSSKFRKDDDVGFSSLSASNGVRCRNDLPPKGNANFAWVQDFNRHQSRTLATLRDTLLPKLLRGALSAQKLNTIYEAAV